MVDPRGPRPRPSVEATASERRARQSAEFVVNLGPPEPLASYVSSDSAGGLELPRYGSGHGSGLGPPAGRKGSGAASGHSLASIPGGGAPGGGGGGGGDEGASPKARPDLLASIDEDSQLTLRYSRICAWVSASVQPPGVLERLRRARQGGEREPEERQILFSVTGEILPGEVLALMGPSGSGKTSLLSVISGRAPRAVRTAGRVTVNGARFTKQAKRRVGFVLQDDLLYETLTVTETLGYAAALRLPRGMTAAERRGRVDDVITALGLGKCRNTIIGGYFRRGISGGERKRVSIGHELLINPAILLLDEPTSGLDSTTALHLLQLLQELAAGGRSIATTIHQPSSRLYQKLDKLMLLADGHTVYYGGAGVVLSWFSSLGFECPFGVNVADFLLDLAQGEAAGGGGGGGAGAVDLVANGGAGGGQEEGGGKAGGGGKGGGSLSGPAAVQALWASYEGFHRTHRQGFTRPEQLPSLTLLLEPPPEVASAKSAANGAAPAGADAAGPGRAASLGRAASRMMSGLLRRGGGAPLDGEDGDEEEGGFSSGGGAPPVRREISRAFSRSDSVAGAAATPGGCGGAAARAARWAGVADRGGASYWVQFKILTLRQLKVRRFESLSGQRFGQLFAIAILTGLFWWQRGRGTSLLAAGDVVGLLFFELLFPAFQALFSALFLFPSEFKMLLKERSSGMYRVSAFYASTVAADLPMDMVLPALFCIVIYFMGGLRLTAAAFFANVLTMVLVTLVSQSWGLLLGAVFMNPKTAQTVASVMMLTFMLVGGFYVRDVPIWIRWVKYLSFVYWGFNVLLKVEFGGATYFDCGEADAARAAAAGAPAQLRPCAPVADLASALSLPVDPNDSAALDVGVLVATLAALRLLIYVALRKKTKAA
ncbi:MAG: hypothetical protein J3K34DRAFT_497894 [Monoraphidium minutum]|nr:MAG: hypothetical protein J3K34DRAFT_497894 [Monoraphidium minutum]